MKRFLICILILGCVLSTTECLAQKFQVKVVKISDGDTFVGLNRDNLQIKFRIWGIDAPEKKQAFGTKSKDYCLPLFLGKTLLLMFKNKMVGVDILFMFTLPRIRMSLLKC